MMTNLVQKNKKEPPGKQTINDLKLLFLMLMVLFIGALNTLSAESVSAGDSASLHQEAEFTQQNLPELTEDSTLEDYLVYASMNSPELKAAFDRWKAAHEKAPQFRALPDPKFSYTYFLKQIETRVGPQRQKFSLSQTFPWFGLRGLRADAELAAADAEENRFENEKLKLFFRVKKSYFEYYYLGKSIDITNDNLKLLTYLENVALTNYKTGLARYSDVIKAQVVIGETEDRLRTLRDLGGPMAARLNAALNRHPDTPIPWPEEIQTHTVMFNDNQLYQWVADYNPELQAYDHMAFREEQLMDLAEKEGLPDFTVGIEFIDIGEARMPDVPDSGKNGLGLMVGLDIPLWRDKYNAAQSEATLRHSEILNEKKERENNILSALKLAIFSFHDAERKINLYRDTLIPKAEQSLNVNEQAFSAGHADFLDLIDAQQTLLEYHLAYERARSDRAIHRAQIEMLVGRELPEEKPDPTAASDDMSDEQIP